MEIKIKHILNTVFVCAIIICIIGFAAFVLTIRPDTGAYADTNTTLLADDGDESADDGEEITGAAYATINGTGKAYDTFEEALADAMVLRQSSETNRAVIKLLQDTETAPFKIEAGRYITIDLNGYMLKSNASNSTFITIAGNFLLEDTYEDTDRTHEVGDNTVIGGLVTGGNAESAGGVNVSGANAVFTLEGGTIAGNTATLTHGGGVYVTSGKFIINGGSICYNTAKSGGGGVYIFNATEFSMNGGEIYSNSANYGGGVTIRGVTMLFRDGNIFANDAKNGGGVYVLADTTLNMSGGVIGGNLATTGGGVYLGDSGKCTLSGGEIAANLADDGAGVYVVGRLTMSGGEIHANSAAVAGGGMELNNSKATLIISDGKIYGNGAVNGGGVCFMLGSIEATGGEIYENNASNGGGIFVAADKTAAINAITLTGNDATNGGAVYMDTGSVLTVTGGAIAENTADNGAGLYVAENAALTMSGITVDGNVATSFGGGIYQADGSTVSLTDVLITGGDATKGGGAYVLGSLALNDSDVTENTCMFATNGGGLFVSENGGVTISGKVTVSGNLVRNSTTTNNIYFDRGTQINIDGSISDGTLIGVSIANSHSGVFAAGYDADSDVLPSVYFFSDADLCITGNNGNLQIVKHVQVISLAVAATCTETGLTQGVVCSTCGKVFSVQTETPATGHVWGEWEIVVRPTETANGLQRHTCEVCGTVEQELIAAGTEVPEPEPEPEPAPEIPDLQWVIILMAALVAVEIGLLLFQIIRRQRHTNKKAEAFSFLPLLAVPALGTQIALIAVFGALFLGLGVANTVYLLHIRKVEAEERRRAEELAALRANSIVTYKLSFTGKVIQSQDDVKIYYSVLKGKLLSYKEVESKFNWDYEGFVNDKTSLARMVMRDGVLWLYLANNPDPYIENNFNIERSTDVIYQKIPCLCKITDIKAARLAVKLIEDLALELGLESQPSIGANYYMPYESGAKLVAKGLAREILIPRAHADGRKSKFNPDAQWIIRYNKSFTAKIIQSPDTVKNYYATIKNDILSYKNTKSRVTWNYDAIGSGRKKLAKFAIRGNTLCLYLALNPDDYADSKYKVERSDSKRFEDTPCLYRLYNMRRVKLAIELIGEMCLRSEIIRGESQSEDYYLPYESTEALIARGLIREIATQEEYDEFMRKRAEQPAVAESEAAIAADEEESVIEEKPVARENYVPKIIVRYNKSFTAKLIQSSKETKTYYSDIKNYILSYEKTKSRVTWHYDAFNSGRKKLAKFAMRGNTLCLYLALNPDDYAETKYKVERTESKKYEETPCLYRIKNGRRAKYALDLIAEMLEKEGLILGASQTTDYILPYETTEALIAKGLIKELLTEETYEEYLRRREQEKNRREAIAKIVVRYNKSFTAKLIQSNDYVKAYYGSIKNEILSYEKTKSRVTWHHDAFNSGRQKLAKFTMRGKTLCLYLALNPDDYADTKYKVERVESKKYEGTPCVYRIKNGRRAKYAIDLIADMCEKHGLARGESQNVDYYQPYDTTESLIQRLLIKELVSEENYDKFMEMQGDVPEEARREFVSAAEVNALLADEVAISLVESEDGARRKYRKKAIINIDTLSRNFDADDTVDLTALKERKLVAKDADYVKVLARGILDKPLNVELQDYSVEAVKMIAIMGGHVRKVI